MVGFFFIFTLESLISLESLENGLFWKDPFSRRPLFRTRLVVHPFWLSRHIRPQAELTNFCAPWFKEIPSFFCGVTPFKTLAAPQPLKIAFPLGNGWVLRSEEGGGIREGRGQWGGGKKKEKRTRKKSRSAAPAKFRVKTCQRSYRAIPGLEWRFLQENLVRGGIAPTAISRTSPPP